MLSVEQLQQILGVLLLDGAALEHSKDRSDHRLDPSRRSRNQEHPPGDAAQGDNFRRNDQMGRMAACHGKPDETACDYDDIAYN